MNTKTSMYLFPISGFLLIVGCGGGQSDWKDILRDGKVFSEEHLERFKEQAHEITSGKIKGVEFHIPAASWGETVGVDATEVERLYGSPTSVVADEWEHLTYYYGEVGIDLDPKTKGVIGVVVPTKKVAVAFGQFLDSVSPPEQPKETIPTGIAKGTITQDDTVMDVKDAFAIWKDDMKNVLDIYLFPTVLSNDERLRLATKAPLNGPFFVAAIKETPDATKWECWYPYATLEVRFETKKPKTAENMAHASFHAYGIKQRNYTTGSPSLSELRSSLNPFVITGNESLEMTFEGETTTGGNSGLSWKVELESQPILE